ncbi:MAG: Fur family transcriptional regulator [Pseudomonadota bacterium]
MGKRGEALRLEVLEALRRAKGPLSAYDILAEMRASNPKAAPMTVYRALNTLADQGLVHRLESLNSYMLCQCADQRHEAILSICDGCGLVEETVAPEVVATMSRAVGKSGFAPVRHIIEVHGICADCGPEQTIS